VVRSETKVLVSHPSGVPNPPPRGPTTSPPKMLVRRRMKVDLPQPESAATPIMIGLTPSARAMLKLLEEAADLMLLFGMKAEGAKAATEPAVRAATETMNFILIFLFLEFR
jgi:hypothetical protein